MKMIVQKGLRPDVDEDKVVMRSSGNVLTVPKDARITEVKVLNGVVRVYVKCKTEIDILDMPFTDADQVVVWIK